MRASRLSLAVAATAALALPAGAQASTTPTYVVTLAVPAGTTCADVVRDVRADYAVTGGAVYTSALCAFSTPLRTQKARGLAADPRVVAVQPDTDVVGF
jgi:hypothetical protein